MRITAVIPYFGYARQDRKSEGRTPISAKLVANMITTAGADRVLAVDLHADQIQGFFDIPVDHLYALPALVEHYQELDEKNLTLVSPDLGNVKVADMYANRLHGELAVIDKRRISGDVAVAQRIIGDVKGNHGVVTDFDNGSFRLRCHRVQPGSGVPLSRFVSESWWRKEQE